MELDRKTKFQLSSHYWLFVALLLLLAGLLGAVTRTYHKSWDITLNGRNSLSPGSIAQLGKLKEPINVTVYAGASSRVGDAVKFFFAPYQRLKPDLKIKFIDPDEQPQLARQAGIQQPGEAVVQIGQRSDRLTSYNESAFINLLVRLARDQDRLVMYLDGHGERKLDGVANHDLGDFGAQLAKRGFKSAPLNLVLAQEVPHNISVLVIAGPRVDLLPTEVAKLKQYVQRGGNLLWLVDTEPLHGLQPLTEQLSIALTAGTVIDLQAKEMNADATIAVGAAYGQHPMLQNFNLITLFPYAREVVPLDSESGWKATPLIQVAARGWLETGALDKPVAFDKGQDKPGPINIAVALQRTVEDRTQRVVVIGNGNFLANQFLGNGGNLDLGLNAINWLSGDDNFITIQPRVTQDAQILLTENTKRMLVIGYLFVLPLGLLLAGGLIWWRRRKS
jgi:ABC-type uncharacterized transport system involved in gliding motility auxiliary subunit